MSAPGDAPQREEAAALTIQAQYRGYREQARFRRSRDAAITLQRHFRLGRKGGWRGHNRGRGR